MSKSKPRAPAGGGGGVRGAWRAEDLRADTLRVDGDAQRTLRTGKVNAIAMEFDPDRFQYIVVNRRKDGGVFIVDGQHRWAAVLKMGWGDQKVPCVVYDGLSQAEEAQLFRDLNRGRTAVRALEDFRVGITARDPVNCEILRVLQACDLGIGDGDRPGCVAAVRSLEVVFRNGMKDGAPILHRTLTTIRDAFGREAANFNGKVIEGLGALYLRYGKLIDQASLAERLARVPGGAAGLRGKAETLRSIRSATIHQCVASVCVDLYNKGRRSGKLEDWGL